MASDSGFSNVGIDNKSTNIPGTKGLKDIPVDDTKETDSNSMEISGRCDVVYAAPENEETLILYSNSLYKTTMILSNIV